MSQRRGRLAERPDAPPDPDGDAPTAAQSQTPPAAAFTFIMSDRPESSRVR